MFVDDSKQASPEYIKRIELQTTHTYIHTSSSRKSIYNSRCKPVNVFQMILALVSHQHNIIIKREQSFSGPNINMQFDLPLRLYVYIDTINI